MGFTGIRFRRAVGASLFPSALALAWLAFSAPELTERFYATGLYPWLARAFAAMNPFAFSVAEPLTAIAAALVALAAIGLARHPEQRLRRALRSVWYASGLTAWFFLLTWGLNYARPPLVERMALSPSSIDSARVLHAGRRAAEYTGRLYRALGESETPTRLDVDLSELSRLLDAAFERAALPGDPIDFRPTPVKPLRSSTLFSRLGISGLFVPFTGEPSVNALPPDVTLPIAAAHEKAHQRGITNEGEANFAAFLACAQPENPTYLRYAAYHFAARYLLGGAAPYVERERLEESWALAGEGALDDLRAIREFWQQFEGPAQDAARRVNDGYLRAMRVPGGVESYGTVVSMMMALAERNELLIGDDLD